MVLGVVLWIVIGVVLGVVLRVGLGDVEIGVLLLFGCEEHRNMSVIHNKHKTENTRKKHKTENTRKKHKTEKNKSEWRYSGAVRRTETWRTWRSRSNASAPHEARKVFLVKYSYTNRHLKWTHMMQFNPVIRKGFISINTVKIQKIQ